MGEFQGRSIETGENAMRKSLSSKMIWIALMTATVLLVSACSKQIETPNPDQYIGQGSDVSSGSQNEETTAGTAATSASAVEQDLNDDGMDQAIQDLNDAG